MKDKKELIFTIICGTTLLLIGIFIIIYSIIQKSKLVYFGIIWVVLWGGLYTYKIIAAAKKLKFSNNSAAANIGNTKEEEQVKENLVNYAFDKLMKEGEDYSVKAEVDGAILVKKIVRWAYFMVHGQDIQAVFSIETDKALLCFQMQGQKLMRIESDICTSIYPMLKP